MDRIAFITGVWNTEVLKNEAPVEFFFTNLIRGVSRVDIKTWDWRY